MASAPRSTSSSRRSPIACAARFARNRPKRKMSRTSRPKPSCGYSAAVFRVNGSCPAVDLKRCEALGDRHELDRIDVDMVRQRRRPSDRRGNVVRRQRLHSGIDRGRLVLVAAETNLGELRTAAYPGLDTGHADACAVQVASQIEAELVHERLGGAVYVAARIRIGTGSRSEIDHVTAPAGDHAG